MSTTPFSPSASRSARLALRRELLVQSIRARRLLVRADIDALEAAARPAALASRLVDQIREHPALALLSVAGFAGLRRVGVARYGSQLLFAWRAWSAARAWMKR